MTHGPCLFVNAAIIGPDGSASEGMDMLVENGLIARVGPTGSVDAAPETRVERLDGAVVMPGLIDCHVHLCFEPTGDPIGDLVRSPDAIVAIKTRDRLLDLLFSGVTFFRDMGGKNHIDIAVRDAVSGGLLRGPGFHASGKVISVTGGHFWPVARVADGPDEVAKAAREQIAAGADLVKVMATGGVMTPKVKSTSSQMLEVEIRAAVEVARRNGVRTAAHAHGAMGIRDAVLAGVDSVEHGVYLDDATADLMAERRVWLVPTFCTGRRMLEVGTEGGVAPFAYEKAKAAGQSHLESFHRARKAGVRIACGTDSGTPFNPCGGTPRELLHLLGEGMRMDEVLRAATLDAARLLGIENSRGSIEEGKIADFLVLPKSPYAFPGVLLENKRVFLGGVEQFRDRA